MSSRPGPHASKAERLDFFLSRVRPLIDSISRMNREPNVDEGRALGGALSVALQGFYDLAAARLDALPATPTCQPARPHVTEYGPITLAGLMKGVAELEAVRRGL